MRGKVLSALALGLAAALVGPAAFASAIPVGYISYDVTGTGVAQFDINNETGVNSSGDSTFPVTTSVSLSDLSLDVKFASGPDTSPSQPTESPGPVPLCRPELDSPAA
jgi:hypothetical protein